MKQVGIMGGTFDPIHNGHILLGKQAFEEYHLDQIWYMPSGQPPHKKDHMVTEAVYRAEMVKLAIKPYPYFCFSDFELKRTGNIYTADTLALLKKEYKDIKFYFIIGADSLYQIETWHEPEKVMKNVTLLVARREYEESSLSINEQIEYLTRKYHAEIMQLHSEEINIASEKLRQMMRNHMDIKEYVPSCINDYIKKNKLYGQKS